MIYILSVVESGNVCFCGAVINLKINSSTTKREIGKH